MPLAVLASEDFVIRMVIDVCEDSGMRVPPGLLCVASDALTDAAGSGDDLPYDHRQNEIRMLDAGEVIQSSPVDGIHLAPEEHRKLGKAVADEVRRIL